MSRAPTTTINEPIANIPRTSGEGDDKPWRVSGHNLVIGTVCGLLCALFGTVANIALRHVATPHDLGWAMLVACVKALPTVLTAMVVVFVFLPRRERGFVTSRAAAALLLIGLTTQFGGNLAFQYALGIGGLGLTVCLCFATLIVTGATLGRVILGASNEGEHLRDS